jgi:hypothetical protein
MSYIQEEGRTQTEEAELGDKIFRRSKDIEYTCGMLYEQNRVQCMI